MDEVDEVLAGVFDSFVEAERARVALIAAGFERDALRIAGRSGLAADVTFDADFDAHPNDSIREQIAKIFISMIGGTARGARDVQRLTHAYPEQAAMHGKAILFVRTRGAELLSDERALPGHPPT